MVRPTPLNEEKILDPEQYIVSKTDDKGIIQYGNDYFIEISGYSESELLGQPHNIIRHPDMPKIIFKMMWERINRGENIMAVIKNLTKDGSYYWIITEFEPKIDPQTKQIIAHTAYRQAAPKRAVEVINPLYQKLLEIEREYGLEASETYLQSFLKEKKLTYDQFVNNTVGNRGLFKMFFVGMKKLFS